MGRRESTMLAVLGGYLRGESIKLSGSLDLQ